MKNIFSAQSKWCLKSYCRIFSFLGLFFGFSTAVVAQYGAMQNDYRVNGNILTNECAVPASGINIEIGEKDYENKEIFWNEKTVSGQDGKFSFRVYDYYFRDIFLRFSDVDSLNGRGLKDTIYLVSFARNNFKTEENNHDWTIEYDYINPLNIVMDYQGKPPCREEDIKPIKTIDFPSVISDFIPVVNNEQLDSMTIASVPENSESQVVFDESPASINVFPNPSVGIFTVEIVSDIEREAMFRVFDDRLRLITESKINLTPGANRTDINLYGKASGTYLLELIGKDIKLSAKLIKSAY